MKKQTILLGIGVCMAVAFSSCKSSQSAYSKAYEKAKQQELAEQQAAPVETTPVVAAPTTPKVVESVPVEVAQDDVRHEKVTVVSGDNNGLLDYSVVCGSFGIKANAEGLKSYLEAEGYKPVIVFNADAAMYRVVVSTYADRASAAAARDAFKAKYPNRKDFQGSWLLYRVQ